MPRLRAAVLRDRVTLSDSDTFTLSLKGLKAVSRVDVIIRATNGATSNQGVPIMGDVDTVEVVDGSRVIHSLSGIQTRALNCYELGHYPPVTLDEQAAAVQEETFMIHFGRWLGDEEYWLDPGMFSNPELRVTVSFTISATAGFATGTGRITVIAWVWDEPPTGRAGTFLTKEYKSFTSAASGDDRTELPRDFPYRLLVVRAFETGIAFDTDITNIKLTVDMDALVLLDVRATQLRDLNGFWFPRFRIPQVLFRTDADTPDCYLAYPEEYHLNALNDLDVASIDARTVNQLTVQLLSLTATPTIAKSTTDTAMNLLAAGLLPHFAAGIPFGDMKVPGTWFDPSGFGKFEAVLTQGGAGAAVSIFGQQVMP